MHYLYRHTRLDKNEPFYIGIGTASYVNNTHKGLYKRAYNKRERNNIWKRIITKTDYEVEIIVESDSYEFIKQKEIEFISLYGRINNKTGILANLTDGGEGSVGFKHSEETKAKLREMNSGENGYYYGKKLSEEHKNNIKQSHAERELTEKHIESIRLGISKRPYHISFKGRKHTEESKIKQRNARLGKKLSVETREKMRTNCKRTNKEVICTLTMKVFESLLKASEVYGISKSKLGDMFRGRTHNTTTLMYKDDFLKGLPLDQCTKKQIRKIINTQTNKQYDNIKEASKDSEFNHNNLTKYISGKIKNVTYFMFLEDFEKTGAIIPYEYRPRNTRVINKETKEVFNSITKAAKSYGISLKTLSTYLLNTEKAIIKLPFEYYN